MYNKIIQGFPTPQKDYYKVYARSITYNQTPYIEDCLNGVAMQKTDFPFVHHVIDDASTDGEQDVIKAWMDKNCDMEHAEYYDNDICTITLVKNKKNPNCTLAAYFLKKNMYGNPKKGELYTPWREVCPFEAICEGDDYWIDPKKLQKQVVFMDSHRDCMLCYHSCKNIFEEGFSGNFFPYGENTKSHYNFEEVIYKYNFQSATILFRKDVTESKLLKELVQIGFSFGDFLIYMTAAHLGDVSGFTECMSVYRRTNQGVSVAVHNGSKSFTDIRAWINASLLFSGAERQSIHKKIGYDLIEAIHRGEITRIQAFILLKLEIENSTTTALKVFANVAMNKISSTIRSIKTLKKEFTLQTVKIEKPLGEFKQRMK